MAIFIQLMKRPRYKIILLHLAFWALYALSEYVANWYHYRPGERHLIGQQILWSLPILMSAAYFTGYWLVPRFLLKERFLPFLTGIVLVAAFVLAARLGALYLSWRLEGYEVDYIPPSKVLKNTIRDYAIIALAVCLMIIDDWRRRGRLNRQLQQAKAQAELQLLKSQLHPHFLFNTLNNIYGQSLQEPEKVPGSIIRLSKILDYLVYYSSKERIPLQKEVELIRNYLALEQLRYGGKLKIDAELPELNEYPKASPLLLLPFVENAFKHGGKDENGKWWVKMQLQMVDSLLVFSIENSKPAKAQEKKGGLGLKNIRERLGLLYPRRHRLHIEDARNYFSVRMEIEL